MTIDKLLSTAAAAIYFSGFFWATATPAGAEHCYHVSNGIIYCYDTPPPEEPHPVWFSEKAPQLLPGRSWSCSYHAHPRTICTALGPSTEGPITPTSGRTSVFVPPALQ